MSAAHENWLEHVARLSHFCGVGLSGWGVVMVAGLAA
jgi:hypothetical protein